MANPLRVFAASLTSADADLPADPAGSPPILVDARRAAALLGVGLRTLRTMDAAGKLPAPVRLSPGCVRWRLAELHDWTQAGCPDREAWEACKAARSK
ncbi:MAG: hypothetical protein U0792_02475 [Gemmataceae bacterium]